jgi:hypothetical protein
MIDTAQQIVTQVAHGDFAAGERRWRATTSSSETFFPVREVWLSLSSHDREALFGSG